MATAVPQAAVAIPRHRFTVEDFARLGEAGIFTDDDRVELIDGESRDMTPIGQPHGWIASTTVAGLRVTVDEIVGRVDDDRRVDPC